VANCTSCGAEILWIEMESGKPMPVNPEPLFESKAGMIYQPTALRRTGGKTLRNALVYQNHWATCPQADEHRKGSKA
jgi:hypothetical protein